MQKWLTTQQMANDISKMDKSNSSKELNISQCNMIAKVIKNLYANGGKHLVVTHIREAIPSYPYDSNGLRTEQKDRIDSIVKELFFWHWFPLSRIRRNMIRIAKS